METRADTKEYVPDIAKGHAVYDMPTSIHRRMKEDTVSTHRFRDRTYISNITTPYVCLEYAATLLTLLLERATQDLRSDSLALRMDAYYWLTSRSSDLYQRIAPRFGIDLKPCFFRDAILAAGMPDFPDDGILCMTIDTEDRTSWSYSPQDESDDVYRSRLARLLSENKEIAGVIECAVLSGVQLRFLGKKASTCETATRTLLACIAANKHQKTTRLAIEGKIDKTKFSLSARND